MEGDDRLVGVIGGMGPDATIDFMSKVVEFTPAESDQDHVRLLVDQNPRTPSRQMALNHEGESPGPVLAQAAARLQQGGAEFLVMPCNTAHAWRDDIVAAVTIPFVSIIDESVGQAIDSADGPIGLLTTPGCFTAGLYQQAIARAGRELVAQTEAELAETMRLIDRIKAGDRSGDVEDGLRNLAKQLVERGASTIVAACTELPLVLNQSMVSVPLIGSTDALARKTVALALAQEPLPES
jgi:aspartate racemase